MDVPNFSNGERLAPHAFYAAYAGSQRWPHNAVLWPGLLYNHGMDNVGSFVAGVVIRNEDELTRLLMKNCPDIERIENSAKGGTPDMLIPTSYGYVWVENKVTNGNRLVFQNTQMAFFVRNRRLPRHLWAWILAAKLGTDMGVLLNVDDVLRLPKQPYSNGKTQVELLSSVSFTKLQQLIDKIGVYRRLTP